MKLCGNVYFKMHLSECLAILVFLVISAFFDGLAVMIRSVNILRQDSSGRTSGARITVTNGFGYPIYEIRGFCQSFTHMIQLFVLVVGLFIINAISATGKAVSLFLYIPVSILQLVNILLLSPIPKTFAQMLAVLVTERNYEDPSLEDFEWKVDPTKKPIDISGFTGIEVIRKCGKILRTPVNGDVGLEFEAENAILMLSTSEFKFLRIIWNGMFFKLFQSECPTLLRGTTLMKFCA